MSSRGVRSLNDTVPWRASLPGRRDVGVGFCFESTGCFTQFKTATRDGLRFHARSLARTRDPSLPPCPTRSHAFSGASGQRRRVAVHRVRTHGEPHPLAVFPNKPYFQLIGSGSIRTRSRSSASDDRGHTRVPRAFRLDSARRAPSTSAAGDSASPLLRGCGLTPPSRARRRTRPEMSERKSTRVKTVAKALKRVDDDTRRQVRLPLLLRWTVRTPNSSPPRRTPLLIPPCPTVPFLAGGRGATGRARER